MIGDISPTSDDLYASEDEDIDTIADRRLFLDIVNRLKPRLDAAKFTYSVQNSPDDIATLSVDVPAGRQSRRLSFVSSRQLEKFESVQFEQYCLLQKYDAVVNYSNGTVEAGVRAVAGTFNGRLLSAILKAPERSGAIELDSTTLDGPQITLAAPTTAFTALNPHVNIRLTIKLALFGLSEHDKAELLIERYSDALFFQIDTRFNSCLALIQARTPRTLRRGVNLEQFASDKVTYPTFEYDRAPISLFWYGRSALATPLLQFLAYYQVVEFFYPVYSNMEAQRRLTQILKGPSFRIERETDVGRLVAAIKSSRSGGFFDERTQLRTTVREVISPADARSFFNDTETSKSYKNEYKKVHKKPIGFQNTELDLRDDIADRLYEIRCKIVHTKHDGSDTQVELLLPYSSEEKALQMDIALMALIARACLVKSGTPIR